ncbi:hypothetical protein JCM5350_007404 [Sporobolomyces pararoseus]
MDPIESLALPQTGPLLPLLPPKLPLKRTLPSLPPRLRSPLESIGWDLSSFTVPAAFPRSYRNSTKSPTTTEGEEEVGGDKVGDKEELWNRLIKPQVESFNDPIKLQDQEELDKQEQLVLKVNRYRPKQKKKETKGLTLVFSHANGFYKEVWEPMLLELLKDFEEDDCCLPIEEIWALDCVLQGDSAILNEDVLGTVFNWCDHGRDILNFIISYIDSEPSPSLKEGDLVEPSLNVDPQLFKLDNDVSSIPPPGATRTIPSERRYRDKIIVGIGHSLGGGGTAFAATACPSLFSSVIFLDPVLVTPHYPSKSTKPLASGALVRREKWNSREEAFEGFLKKAFFRSWDEKVLKGYCEFGLRETSDGKVALKTTARNEAGNLGGPEFFFSIRANLRLATLPSSLPVHWIWAEENRSVLPEFNIRQLVEERVPHSTMSRVEGAGHLIVHEKPKETARLIGNFLKKTYPSSTNIRVAKL